MEAAPLPSWLTDPPPIERVGKVKKKETIKSSDTDRDFGQQDADLERQTYPPNPAAWEAFKTCKDVDSLYNWAATYGIDIGRFPKLLFSRLCHAGQPLPVLLHALEDTALGTPGNLNFLLDWQLRQQKGDGRLQKRLRPDDMALLQEWMNRQLYLGLKCEEDILVFLRFVSRVNDAAGDESSTCNLIASFQGLQLSPVFGFRDLGTEAQFQILDLIIRGPVTRQSLELGFSLVEAVPQWQCKGTDRKISAFIGSVLHAHASRREHRTLDPEVMSTILDTIWVLPRELAQSVTLITTDALIIDRLRLPTIEAGMMQPSDLWLSALGKKTTLGGKLDFKITVEKLLGSQKPEVAVPYLQQLDERNKASFMLHYWFGPRSRYVQHEAQYLFNQFCSAKQKDSPWVSMLQAATRSYTQLSHQSNNAHIRQIFKTLQMLNQSETIVEIVKQARKLKAIIDDDDVVYIIREHLGEQLHLAERIFHFYPGLRLEKCPELAERMILNPRIHPETPLRYMRRYTSRFLVHSERSSREQFSQPRIDLLGRMALAYSMAPHLTPRMAFKRVYECYTQHMKEGLGPPPVATARALTQAGLIRPSQAGQRVDTRRLRWIASVVRSTKGADAADQIDEMIYGWSEVDSSSSAG